MRISFRQSGGFLGNTRVCDTESLDVTVVSQARNLLVQSGITSSVKLISPVARDANIYTLTVSEQNTFYEIIVDDASMPEKLGPLVDLLAQYAKPTKS